jgi:hypothetical protein
MSFSTASSDLPQKEQLAGCFLLFSVMFLLFINLLYYAAGAAFWG